MSDLPGDDLEDTRAALAPTLEATAAILPWVAKPRVLRFDKKLNERWIAACTRLAVAWAERHGESIADIRPSIFALYGIAIETADADCLRLGEALASAADTLDDGAPGPRLAAALSATLECLGEEGGLEHVLFPERARHFAQRIENSIANEGSARSLVVDRIFVGEAGERLERMHDALTVLPPDAYALKLEATELIQQAEHIELYGIVHLARQVLQVMPNESNIGELDSQTVREKILFLLNQLEAAISVIDV